MSTTFRYLVIAHKQSNGSEFVYAQTHSHNGALIKAADAERSGFGPARIIDNKA